MRFIASGDWQLGMAARFLDDQARPRFVQARFDAVREIGRLAQERGAAFVVVCGDVFESNQLDRQIVSRTFEALRGFTVPVVLLPGNHDPLDAASIYDSPAFTSGVPDQVHVLRDSEPFEVVPGVEIVGAPWFSKRPERDLVADACAAL
ncbi:MAG: metallophosphoesterase, partial [Bifidobacteriaceae bacterium]|nr:metallophosphoesterase [Bifidobacteriaceae bacterium]